MIGGAGPVDFYAKTVSAIPIPDSSPGIYIDLLGSDSEESQPPPADLSQKDAKSTKKRSKKS